MKNFKKAIFILASTQYLAGCAAIQTAASKRNLDVQNKMSATIFLEPVEDSKDKTIFVQFHNTSDKKDFLIESELRNTLATRGYKITENVKSAHYMLQVNILQVGKSSPSAAEAAMYKGYGYDGAFAVGSVVYLAGGSSKAILAGGLLGGLTSVVADSVVKDVYFSVITDIQVKKRLPQGVTRSQTSIDHLEQMGTANYKTAIHAEKTSWKTYQTRILSSANKVNLDFDEALPALRAGVSQSIAGLF